MINAVFTVWFLIVRGFLPASVWPESILGPMPVCNQPAVMAGMQMCNLDPALAVFLDQMKANQDVLAETAIPVTLAPARISNGF